MSFAEDNTTIIIPSRNIDFLLKECLFKIRNLYSSVKIIVILDEYEEKDFTDFDLNIKFLKSVNKNMSAKRNYGVEQAETTYIALIDSDAYPDNNWLENAVEFLNKNKNYSAVTGNQMLPADDSFEKQCLRQVRFSKLFTYSEWCKVIDLNAKEQDCSEFMTSNLIMKKEDYLNLGGMNENIYLAEDNEFSARIVRNGYKIRFIPQVRVFHHEASFLPFMKKIFSIAKYYVENLKNLEKNLSFYHKIRIFLPLIGVIFLIFLFLCSLFFKFSLLINLILPLFILLVFLKEAYSLSKQNKSNKIKSISLYLYFFIAFCFAYLIGQIFGFLSVKSVKVQDFYKHY